MSDYSKKFKLNMQSIPMSNIEQGPILHPYLSLELEKRIKEVFGRKLAEVNDSSMHKTLDAFKRDEDPEAEILVWEHIAAVYQALTQSRPCTLEQKKQVYNALLCFSLGGPEEEASTDCKAAGITDAEFIGLKLAYHASPN